MRFRVAFALRRRAIVVRGVPAGILLLGLLALPYLLAGSLSPEEAEKGVREYLLREVTQQQSAELAGVSDQETARRWEARIRAVNDTEFVSVSVKRAVVAPPFRKRTEFVVRAVTRDADEGERTRYFRFGAAGSGSVRESSRLGWYLPL